MDGHFASEIYITPAGGATAAEPVRNVTRFATWNTGVSWSRYNNKLAFISERIGNGTQVHILSLMKPYGLSALLMAIATVTAMAA